MSELSLSRRELLRGAAGVGLFLALEGVFRGSAQAVDRAPVSSTPVATEPVAAPTVEVENQKSLELERILSRVGVVDIGAVDTNGKVEPLDQSQMWSLLTSESKTNESLAQLQEDTKGLNIQTRVLLHFLRFSDHGKTVMHSLEMAKAALFKHDDPELHPDFSPITLDTNQTLLTIEASKHVYLNEGNNPVLPERRRRGERMTLSIHGSSDTTFDRSKQVVSCSFQTGKIVAELLGEGGNRINQIMSTDEVRTLVNSFTDRAERLPIPINSEHAGQTFIFPPKKSAADIAAIRVSVAGEVEPATYVFDREKWVSEERSTLVVASSSTDPDPAIKLELQFTDGSVLQGIEKPSVKDLEYDYAPFPTEPTFLGVYHPDNPNRQENLAQMADFLAVHPDQFFVMALGNYGDVLSDEEVDKLPQNVIFVGQVLSAEMLETEPERYSYTTMGNAAAGMKSLFVDTGAFGVEGWGSSLAVPIASLACSSVIESTKTPLSRDALVDHLREFGLLQKGTVGEDDNQTAIQVLDFAALRDYVNAVG